MAFGSLGMKTAKCIMGVELVGGKWRSIIMIGFYHVISQTIEKLATSNDEENGILAFLKNMPAVLVN